MSNFLKSRRAATSIGERPASRVLALNAFARVPDEVWVEFRWVRTAAAPEVWRAQATVPRRSGESLRKYLESESTWEAFQGTTAPLDDPDRDVLALPASTEDMLLLQYEPRHPQVSALAGECQRVCVYYDPPAAAWRATQWSVAVAGDLIEGLRFVEVDGRLALDDAGTAVAFLAEDATGRLALDDEVLSGVGLLATETRIVTY